MPIMNLEQNPKQSVSDSTDISFQKTNFDIEKALSAFSPQTTECNIVQENKYEEDDIVLFIESLLFPDKKFKKIFKLLNGKLELCFSELASDKLSFIFDMVKSDKVYSQLDWEMSQSLTYIKSNNRFIYIAEDEKDNNLEEIHLIHPKQLQKTILKNSNQWQLCLELYKKFKELQTSLRTDLLENPNFFLSALQVGN